MPAVDQYESAMALKGADSPTYTVTTEDQRRLTAYWTYNNMMSNVARTWKNSVRLSVDDGLSDRYLPVARVVVEATNRYLCTNPELVLPAETEYPPGAPVPTPEEQRDAIATLSQLFKRERVVSKLLAVKRQMLVSGDSILHITADPTKMEGSRISVYQLEPETYFPIHSPLDTQRVIGCYLVNIVNVTTTQQVAQRLEYRRILTPDDVSKYGGAIGNVYVRMSFWEVSAWDDREEYGLSTEDLSAAGTLPAWAGSPDLAPIMAGMLLPPEITSIPVYHFKNGEGKFGVSELQGIETALAGINQTATDEDVAVVMQGIGVYYTDSGRPKDAQGNDVPWELSPASILELEAGSKIGRLEGATNIESLLSHAAMLRRAALEGTGTPEVAVGTIDTSGPASAESGVALAIRFAPVLSKNVEKEQRFGQTVDQILYDLLNGWFPAFEGKSWNGVMVQIGFGNPIPVDRAATLQEILQMVEKQIISLEFARQLIQDKLGYVFPDGMGDQVAGEQANALDAAGARLDAAMAGQPGAQDQAVA